MIPIPPAFYGAVAKLLGAFVLVGAVGAAVLAYGHRCREEGVAAERGKWALAEAKRTAALSRAEAERARDNLIKVQTQQAISQEVDRAHQANVTALRALYGPGRVRNVAAGTNRAPGLRAPATSPGEFDGGSADYRLGAGSPATESQECRALRSDAAVTTAQLLNLRSWVVRQGLGRISE